MDANEIDALVLRAQAGQAEAFDELVLHLHRDVAGFVAARLPVPTLVDELVQDAFVAVFEHLGDYQPRGTFTAWVKGHAHNLLRRHLHNLSRGLAHGDALERGLAALAAAATAEEAAACVTTWERRSTRLDTCLGRLTPVVRQLLHLRYVDGVPLARLAQRLKRTMSAIDSLLVRSKAALRECLDRVEVGDGH